MKKISCGLLLLLGPFLEDKNWASKTLSPTNTSGPFESTTILDPNENSDPMEASSSSPTNNDVTSSSIATSTAMSSETPPPLTPTPEPIDPPPQPELLGRGHLKPTSPVTLRNFLVNIVHTKCVGADTAKSAYPIDEYVDCTRFSATHCAYFAAITSVVEPQTYKQWRKKFGERPWEQKSMLLISTRHEQL